MAIESLRAEKRRRLSALKNKKSSSSSSDSTSQVGNGVVIQHTDTRAGTTTVTNYNKSGSISSSRTRNATQSELNARNTQRTNIVADVNKILSKAPITRKLSQTQVKKAQEMIKQQQFKQRFKTILPIIARQQQQQQQTVTPEIKALEKKRDLIKLPKSVSFELLGKQKVRRAFKGETLVYDAIGAKIRKKDGTFRNLTFKESQEILPKDSVSLNPFNVGTMFWGTNKDIANLINNPNKKQIAKDLGEQILTNPGGLAKNIAQQAILNPFGFIGDVATGTAVFGAGAKLLKLSKLGTIRSLTKVKGANSIRQTKISKQIKSLKTKGIKPTTKTPAGKKLNDLNIEFKIIDLDIKDLNKAIRVVKQNTRTKLAQKLQIKKFKNIGKSFKSRIKARINIQRIKKIDKVKRLPIIKFKAGSTRQILETNLNKVYGIPKKILQDFSAKKLNLINNRVKRLSSKQTIRFTIGTRKEVLIAKLSKVFDISKTKLSKLKTDQINNIAKQLNKLKPKQKTLTKFKVGSAKQVLETNLNKVYGIPKKILQELSIKKLALINNRIKRLTLKQSKPIAKFTIGTKKEILVIKLNQLLDVSKTKLNQLKLDQINTIVKNINEATPTKTTFTVKPKPTGIIKSKKGRIGRQQQLQINKVVDQTKEIHKAAKLNQNDIIRFTIGDLTESKSIRFRISDTVKKNNQAFNKMNRLLSDLRQLKNVDISVQKLRLLKLQTQSKIINKYFNIIKNLRVIKTKVSQRDLEKIVSKITSDLRKTLQEVDKIIGTIKKTDIDVLTDTIKVTERAIKRITDTATPQRLKIPRIKTKTKLKPIPKIIKLNFDDMPKTKNKRQGYLIQIKKGNQVLFKTNKLLPENRATNLARQFTDKTIGASHSKIKKGRTNIKDVSKQILANKFRKKKSKLKKVQKEVEKRKFRLDNKGERIGIKSKAQLNKNIKKLVKKFSKKKKSSKKNRKPSKNKK